MYPKATLLLDIQDSPSHRQKPPSEGACSIKSFTIQSSAFSELNLRFLRQKLFNKPSGLKLNVTSNLPNLSGTVKEQTNEIIPAVESEI